MKKSILTIVLCLVSLLSMAQNNHMTFMGIPMGGTISQFQTELAKKNIRVSPDNKRYPSGQRAFTGKFSGEQADIIVWYNEKTNLVYRGKAMIEREGKEQILQVLASMEQKLDIKYGTDNKTEDTYKDDYDHTTRCLSYLTDKGRIDLFITGHNYTDVLGFTLHIDYHDLINDALNTIDEMNDL